MRHYELDAHLSHFCNKKIDGIIKRQELVYYVRQHSNEDFVLLDSRVSTWLANKKKTSELIALGGGLYRRNVGEIPSKLSEMQRILGVSSKTQP